MRPHIIVTCAYCATPFKTWQSKSALYCSRPCYWTDRPSRLAARFWCKVEKTAGCWVWIGAISRRHGYGKISVGLHPERSNRVAWTLASGEPIPDGLFVCHTCDVRRCVRNDDHGVYIVDGVAYERRGHLFLAPLPINALDMAEKGRSLRGERNGQAKLTPVEVLEIRRRHAAGGINQAQLGREYGVSRRTVGMLLSGDRWRHV